LKSGTPFRCCERAKKAGCGGRFGYFFDTKNLYSMSSLSMGRRGYPRRKAIGWTTLRKLPSERRHKSAFGGILPAVVLNRAPVGKRLSGYR
jgi:hypothetical protein